MRRMANKRLSYLNVKRYIDQHTLVWQTSNVGVKRGFLSIIEDKAKEFESYVKKDLADINRQLGKMKINPVQYNDEVRIDIPIEILFVLSDRLTEEQEEALKEIL